MPQIRQFGYGVGTGDVHEVLESTLLVERKGFDIARFGDHTLTLLGTQVQYPGAMAMVTAMGMATKRIMVSIGVTDPYRRHPVALAQDVATLDRLTNGRAALGLGAGEMMNLTPFGIEWDKPLAHLSEATAVIKRLWMADPEHPTDFRGAIFKLERAYLQVKPVRKPHPPIYLGALSPKTRELAGLLGDGWYPAAENPQTFKKHLRDVERGVKRAGRKIEDLDMVAIVPTAISEDREEAYRAVERSTRLNWLMCGRKTLEEQGYKVDLPANFTIQRIIAIPKALALLKRSVVQIPRKFVEATAVYGTVDDCIGKIEEYLQAGATSIDIRNNGPDVVKALDLYGKRIIPYFKEQSQKNLGGL